MEVGPLSVVVQQGQVFDYFDEVRKVIEPARSDLFFVDRISMPTLWAAICPTL